MFSRIVTNTPVWVWGLLLALLWLGLNQIRTRTVRSRQILILPTIMTMLSLSGTTTSFGVTPLVLLTWAIATGIGVRWIILRPPPSLTRYDRAADLFHLPGSWIPLALILGIFTAKYATGVTLAIQPQ